MTDRQQEHTKMAGLAWPSCLQRRVTENSIKIEGRSKQRRPLLPVLVTNSQWLLGSFIPNWKPLEQTLLAQRHSEPRLR